MRVADKGIACLGRKDGAKDRTLLYCPVLLLFGMLCIPYHGVLLLLCVVSYSLVVGEPRG